MRNRLNSGGSRQAALIQNDGAGHLAFSVDSACTYDIIKRYFVEGVVPEDTLCGTNFRGFVGDPFGDWTNRSTSTSIISAPLPDSTGAVKNGATATNQRSFLATVLWSAICVLFSSVVSVQLHYL
ncbi:hypothetical protein FRC02_004754 [Tulasnella sp. 418]|nr:hypothetical protein FRC02_004754 [Tulasnella sp. 418]